MQLYGISFRAGTDSKVQSDLKQLAERVTTIEEILEGWPVDDGHSIWFGTGLEDDEPELRLIAVEFSCGKTVVAEAYFTRDEPSKTHPSVIPMTHHQRGYSRNGGIKLDDAAWNSWQASLGFTYSDALCGDIAPRTALIPYLLTFILTDGGDVRITKADYAANPNEYADEITELEAEGVDPNKLLTVYAGYQSVIPINGVLPGWSTSVSFTMDS